MYKLFHDYFITLSAENRLKLLISLHTFPDVASCCRAP